MTDNHYDIGYKKPPQHTRFAKGKSGNPRGRPKEIDPTESLKDLINIELLEKITGQENGKSVTMTKKEALAKRLVNSAINGDKKAMDLLSKVFLPPTRSTAEKLDVESLPRPIFNIVMGDGTTRPMDEWQKEKEAERLAQETAKIGKKDS